MTEAQEKYVELFDAGITQTEIARCCGVNPSTVHKALVRAGRVKPQGRTYETDRPREPKRKPPAPKTLSIPPPTATPDYSACPHRNELRQGCSILTTMVCRSAAGRLPCGFFPPETERRKSEGSYVPKEERKEDT